MTRSPALLAALAAALTLGACGGDDNSPPPSGDTTQDYITASIRYRGSRGVADRTVSPGEWGLTSSPGPYGSSPW